MPKQASSQKTRSSNYRKIIEGASEKLLKPYSYFFTYEWAQSARLIGTGKPWKPWVMLHSSLLGPFVSNEENEVVQEFIKHWTQFSVDKKIYFWIHQKG